jgi:hypothetical protein
MRPIEVEVASVRLVKKSRKTVSNPVAATWVAVGASSSKGVAGVKRAVVHVRKCRIPALPFW